MILETKNPSSSNTFTIPSITSPRVDICANTFVLVTNFTFPAFESLH